MTTHNSNYDGWSYDLDLRDESLFILDLAHDNHPLCKSAGIIKSYAQLDDPNGGNTFIPFDLGFEGMAGGAQMSSHTYSPGHSPRSPDYYYNVSSQIVAPFNIPDFHGAEGQTLSGSQYYAFTAPSSTPRHETTGFTPAGRFYPSLDFAVNPRPADPDLEHISKLRFDYMIDIDVNPGGRRHMYYNFVQATIETFVDPLIEIVETFTGPAPKTQQAGFFKDLDVWAGSRLLRELGPGMHTFSHAEKPLIWEVAADGILDGTPPEDADQPLWDNIHSWGSNWAGLVSTPGMPYGFHLHWRWAASVTDKSSMVFGRWFQNWHGSPELAGRDSNNNPVFGGPLIDPRCPSLDLRMAFVKKETADAFAALDASSHDEFSSLFESIKATPDVIKDGEDCVLIMSIVVHREDPDQLWQGTIFPHGIFFPHTYNPDWKAKWFLLPPELAYHEQYITAKPGTAKWKRNPS